MLNLQTILATIRTKSKLAYSKMDIAHNANHVERTVNFALGIMKSEGGDPFIIEAGAWLHQFHEDENKILEILYGLNLEQSVTEQLLLIAKNSHVGKVTFKSSKELRIVFDASALEFIGPYGSVRELYCNLTTRNMPWSSAVTETRRIQKLYYNALTTTTAQDLAKNAQHISDEFWLKYDEWLDVKHVTGQI
jgi:HD superfamily phosphodiesterase